MMTDSVKKIIVRLDVGETSSDGKGTQYYKDDESNEKVCNFEVDTTIYVILGLKP